MSIKIATYIFFCSVLVLQSCSDSGVEPTVEYYELDVREAAYRYLFLHNASGGTEKYVQVYFLSINGYPYAAIPARDPSEELLNRFSGNRPVVKGISQCRSSDYGGVVDRETGEYGMIFSTGPMKMLDIDRIEIWGGYYVNGISASLNRLVLQRVKWREWVVVIDELHGIS